MHSVDEAERRALLRWSVSLCAGAILLAPLAARSSIEISAEHELGARDFQLPAISSESPSRGRLSLRRDPFSADPAPVSNASVGPHVRAGALLGIVLPPNSGAPSGVPAPMDSSATVAAIITGDRAQALVYQGERSRIVSVGDRLEGRKVTLISSDGIHLDDGSIRRLSETQP
jgi:hypothetical protein